MALSLSETQAAAKMAAHLYSFLPGQAHPFADQRISFAGIAHELGLGQFWSGGSKLPAITALLEKTLDGKRDVFCSLLLEIVRRGIKYRGSKSNPITREDVTELNELMLKVKFKIPELWDQSFLEALPSGVSEKPAERIEKGITPERLNKLRGTFLRIEKLSPQERGFAFEGFLNELFEAFGLDPRGSFRLKGEQIDGSLDFENSTYLVEAKWQNKPVGQNELLVFRGKVEGKATWSRGIFISVGGFTDEGLMAFSRGRPTNLIAMTGQDLYFILDGKMRLDEAIRLKTRRAAETGEVMVSVYELVLECKT